MSAPFPPLQPYQIALMLAERIPEPTRTPAIAFVCGPGHLRADLMIDEVAHWPTPVITPEMVKVALDDFVQYQCPTVSRSSTLQEDKEHAYQGIAAALNRMLQSPET